MVFGKIKKMLVKSQVRYIQSLGQKKFRDAEGTFVAEGPKLIMELLNMANLDPVHFFATKRYLEEMKPARVPVPANCQEISEKELAIMDSYEPEEYTRHRTTLRSGKEAWIYVAA